jgi:hypothetical protein
MGTPTKIEQSIQNAYLKGLLASPVLIITLLILLNHSDSDVRTFRLH